MIDWTKPIQTRDGQKVEFLRKLNLKNKAVAGGYFCIVKDDDGFEEWRIYNADGSWLPNSRPSDYDIINAPERLTLIEWEVLSSVLLLYLPEGITPSDIGTSPRGVKATGRTLTGEVKS